MIVGICGYIGSGKDTAADYLVNEYGFRRESFANTLKDAVAAVFGWDRDALQGLTPADREWREQVDPWWAERLNMPNLTPRLMLQLWGTEVCRRGFHEDIWVSSLENKMRNSDDNFVITDCRFPNEVNAIKSLDGKVIQVTRGADPKWIYTAQAACRGDAMASVRMEDEFKVHASEWAWADTKFDAVLDNNKDVPHLYAQLKNLVSSHLDAIELPLFASLSDN